jgi:beta-lactam-binding protein with PASTA domain
MAASLTARLRAIWPTTVQGRDRLRIGSILGGATLLGYLLTCVAYPAPLIARDQSVPRVLGLPRAAAENELQVQGFKTKVEGEMPDPVIPAGHILWQDPPPETELARGAVVTLTVSSGPGPVSVPDVIAFEPVQARQVLEAAGLRIGNVDTVANAAEAGVIVATRPAAGASRTPGGAIDLVVSRGPADIRIPDLIGLRQEEARDRLESVGLRLGAITTRPARRGAVGIVVEQRPAGGALAPHEGRVSLVISN